MTRANLPLCGRFMPFIESSRRCFTQGGRYASFIPSPLVGLILALASSRAIFTAAASFSRYCRNSSGGFRGSSDSILSWRAFCIRRLNLSPGSTTIPALTSLLISFQSTLFILLDSMR